MRVPVIGCMYGSSRKMSTTFVSIMREKLRNFSVDSEGQLRGHCDTQEEIEGLLTQLKCIGYSYSVRSSTHTSKHSEASGSPQRVFFSLMKGNVTIRFFGSAFSVESASHRECLFGPQYRDNWADHVITKRKGLWTLDSRKSDCPATFSVKCIRVYPGYSIESGSAHPEIKKKVLARLKKDLMSPNKPTSFLQFHIVASPPNHHTHCTESIKANGDIHPLLANEITSMVKNGITSVKVIKLHLEKFVNTHFSAALKPDRDNKMFYPKNKLIYTHMYQAVHKTKKKTTDQDALQNQINEGQEESTSDEIHFQSCLEVETSNSNSELCQQARELCENLISLTYNCSDETIKKLIDGLRVVQHNTELSIYRDNGLPLPMASTSEQ